MELSDSLLTLFSGKVSRRNGKFVVEVPEREVDLGEVTPGDTYRVALLPQTNNGSSESSPSPAEPTATPGGRGYADSSAADDHPTPPVEEGEVRQVEIETLGDQGDGIAKIERGFVVIVPGREPGDKARVEIENVQENFAIGEPVDE